jgi:hypothetical protein
MARNFGACLASVHVGQIHSDLLGDTVTEPQVGGSNFERIFLLNCLERSCEAPELAQDAWVGLSMMRAMARAC